MWAVTGGTEVVGPSLATRATIGFLKLGREGLREPEGSSCREAVAVEPLDQGPVHRKVAAQRL